MIAYPAPHFSKLKATLESSKLPSCDRPQLVQAMKHYVQWIADLDGTMEADEPNSARLRKMVDLLNQYRLHIDIDLILNSQSGWLYRQKGQIKLDNSILEEFLPRLVYSCLESELSQLGVTIGPTTTFSGVWFNSTPKGSEPDGGLNIRTKDHDFAISRPLYLNTANTPHFAASAEKFNLAYKEAYINFLIEHPYKADVFEIFIENIRDVLTYEPIDQATALEQGYF